MKWQLRFLKNSIIGIFPIGFQEKLRRVKRKIVPHKIVIEPLALNQGLQQIEMLKASGKDISNCDYLELGPGWSPVIPLVFFLAGCKSLILVDAQRLMDDHTFSESCKQLMEYKHDISKKLNIGLSNIEERLSRIGILPLDLALKEMNCKYLAPYNLLNNDIPDHSFDIITSRAVLEHIPPKIVSQIFCEFKRIIRPDGAMCHIIDNSDHWEHNDKSISRLNFLKFSQRTFAFFSSMNRLDYQNRLRHSQYIKMIEGAGFKIIYDKSPPDDNALNSLNKLKIHYSFNYFLKNDLAVLTSYIVAGSNN